MQTQEKLGQAITSLKVAQTASQQVSIAKAKAQAADSQIMESQSQLEQAQLRLRLFGLLLPESLASGALKPDKT